MHKNAGTKNTYVTMTTMYGGCHYILSIANTQSLHSGKRTHLDYKNVLTKYTYGLACNLLFNTFANNIIKKRSIKKIKVERRQIRFLGEENVCMIGGKPMLIRK
jgi:hypothetical protein